MFPGLLFITYVNPLTQAGGDWRIYLVARDTVGIGLSPDGHEEHIIGQKTFFGWHFWNLNRPVRVSSRS